MLRLFGRRGRRLKQGIRKTLNANCTNLRMPRINPRELAELFRFTFITSQVYAFDDVHAAEDIGLSKEEDGGLSKRVIWYF